MIRRLLKSAIESFPEFAQFLRNGREFLDRNQAFFQTPWGFSLAGHEAMASGQFEPEETALIRSLLQEVDVFVNVGANVGYYCCHALSLGRSVIAVEPNSRNVHYLLRNIAKNGWARQAEVFPVALGERVEILPMWGGNTGASLIKGWARNAESHVNQVPVITLDRLLGQALEGRRALILVDVEGAEYALLKGAVGTLHRAPRPTWLMEIESTSHQPLGITTNPNLQATFDMFFEAGYTCRGVSSLSESIEPHHVQAVARGESRFVRSNFIFS